MCRSRCYRLIDSVLASIWCGLATIPKVYGRPSRRDWRKFLHLAFLPSQAGQGWLVFFTLPPTVCPRYLHIYHGHSLICVLFLELQNPESVLIIFLRNTSIEESKKALISRICIIIWWVRASCHSNHLWRMIFHIRGKCRQTRKDWNPWNHLWTSSILTVCSRW